MTKTGFLVFALTAAASFGTMSGAKAVVPGSDTYDRARDTVASQSVISSSPSAARGDLAASPSYGYPIAGATRSPRNLVPGSSVGDSIVDGDAIMSVVNPTHGRTFQAYPGFVGRIVPGSDSF